MKNRRASILLVIFACICASGATGLYFAFRTPPKEHYEQLQKGMSRAEVERILGGRPSEVLAKVEIWYGPYGNIRAHFDENDKLAKCILYPPPYGPLVSFFVRLEEDMNWHLNQNEYYDVSLCEEGYHEFPSGGPYAERPPQILVLPKDRGVIPPLLIFETDGASSIRR